MTRSMLVIAFALASISFSPRQAESAEAPWCAVISMSEDSVYWDCQEGKEATLFEASTFSPFGDKTRS
jgi:hypothetical protein